jgi:hypothetical protein
MWLRATPALNGIDVDERLDLAYRLAVVQLQLIG